MASSSPSSILYTRGIFVHPELTVDWNLNRSSFQNAMTVKNIMDLLVFKTTEKARETLQLGSIDVSALGPHHCYYPPGIPGATKISELPEGIDLLAMVTLQTTPTVKDRLSKLAEMEKENAVLHRGVLQMSDTIINSTASSLNSDASKKSKGKERDDAPSDGATDEPAARTPPINSFQQQIDLLLMKFQESHRESEERNRKSEERNRKLDKTIGSLKEELAQQKGELDQHKEKLAQQKGELDQHKEKLAQQQGELDQHKEKLAQQKGELNQHKEKLAQQKEELDEHEEKLVMETERRDRDIAGLKNALDVERTARKESEKQAQKYMRLITPIHLRVLLDDARDKVLEVVVAKSWESYRGEKSVRTLSEDISKKLSSQPQHPSDEAIMFLCSFNSVRDAGNRAAHSATKQDIKSAIKQEVLGSQERRLLEELYQFTYREPAV